MIGGGNTPIKEGNMPKFPKIKIRCTRDDLEEPIYLFQRIIRALNDSEDVKDKDVKAFLVAYRKLPARACLKTHKTFFSKYITLQVGKKSEDESKRDIPSV